MKSRTLTHIFITLLMAAALWITASCAGCFVLSCGISFAATEKEDPVITYEVPEDLDLTWDRFCLNARTVNCTADLTYRSAAPQYFQVDESGVVTILNHSGENGGTIIISVPETETTRAKDFYVLIMVHWVPQAISCKSSYSTTMGTPVTIPAKAIGKLSYKSSDSKTAKVSAAGKVTFLHPGTVTIHVRAEDTGIYWVGKKDVKVSCRMPAPTLKVSRPKSRCAKLSWSKVGGAQKYIVYVKYPGKKKYKAVLSEPAKVKSVTHKGLKKGKKYKYKVRAVLICEDGVYYSPYSKVKTVKIK